jgi:tellurite resistance protein
MISHHAALIYTMVLVSAADRDMSDTELRTIGQIVGSLPAFAEYDRNMLPTTTAACAELLDQEDGLDEAFELIRAALPPRLRETAYALACEVAAAGGDIPQEQLRLLQLLRHNLGMDRLVTAAIERGVRARHTTL